MEKAGSTLNIALHLQRSDRIRQEILKSSSNIKYSSELNKISTALGKALKNSNYKTILDIEKVCVQRDFQIFGTEQAQSSESGHRHIIERWQLCSDPEKARADFISSYAPANLPKAKAMDTIMKSLINTQCRRLSEYAKGNTSPAERLFFTRRAECLKAIYKEHIRHIEQALGITKGLGKSKDLER